MPRLECQECGKDFCSGCVGWKNNQCGGCEMQMQMLCRECLYGQEPNCRKCEFLVVDSETGYESCRVMEERNHILPMEEMELHFELGGVYCPSFKQVVDDLEKEEREYFKEEREKQEKESRTSV